MTARVCSFLTEAGANAPRILDSEHFDLTWAANSYVVVIQTFANYWVLGLDG